MDHLDRRGLTLLAAGLGLGIANIVLAGLGRPLDTWRIAIAGGLMIAGLAVLAVGMQRGR